jgi:ADP-ribosylglycohydrolase
MEAIRRYRGSLLGLAAGDALGTTLEFEVPGRFQPVEDIVGGGPFDLEPGQWTDDTSLALCLSESLIECRAFDPIDQLERYCRWWRHGHLSSKGSCFDIGNTTAQALSRFERTGEAYCGPTSPLSAGNGSLMRLAPVPLFLARRPRRAVERSADSSRTTHQATEAIDACRYLGALIVGAIQGASKEELLSDHYSPVAGLWQESPLAPKIAAIASGSFQHLNPPEIRGSGYAVECLEAALWAFAGTTTFREGALRAVNLGNDADTTGAVYVQLAGAFYGEEAIPAEWRAKLALQKMIEGFAAGLYELANATAR